MRKQEKNQVNGNATNNVASKKQFKDGVNWWSVEDYNSKVKQYMGNADRVIAIKDSMQSPIADYLLTAEDARELYSVARTFPLSDESLYTFAFVYEKGVVVDFIPWKLDKEGVVFVGWFQDDDNDIQHYDLDSFIHTAAIELLEVAGKTFLYCDR